MEVHSRWQPARSGGADAGYAVTAGEWESFIRGVPHEVRQAAAHLAGEAAQACVEAFYAALGSHPAARDLVTNEMVDSRLRHSLRRWLLDLFKPGPLDMQALVATQVAIGKVHARIRVPFHAVLHGARVLKRELARRAEAEMHHGVPGAAVRQYCYMMVDIAVEVLSHAFADDLREAAQTEGIYQAIAIPQDMALERETQRAALLEWNQRLLFDICCGQAHAGNRLAESSFGLWLRHKGGLLFQGLADMAKVNALVERIDGELLPTLQAGAGDGAADVLHELHGALGDIGYLVDGMFGVLESMEGGRDPLTRTLNRRFLSTIVAREVAAAARSGTPFSVLMVDVDHFKAINDKGGHAAGDVVLRHVAELLLQGTRNSDFVFRYGGEEFVIALVETPLGEAMEVAERIRLKIARAPVVAPGVGEQAVTVSIGVAQYGGHPDYAVLLDAADKALYRAKRNGRNRCEAAGP